MTAAFFNADVYITKNAGPLCEQHAQRLITWLQLNAISLFPKGGGKFLSNLWHDPAKVTKSKATVKAGWGGPGAAYGYVLERGPMIKRVWTIAPKNTLTSSHGPSPVRGITRNAGEPIKALRMVGPNGVVYRKKVTHVWNESMLRPHWSKAMKAERKKFVADWRVVLDKAIKMAGA